MLKLLHLSIQLRGQGLLGVALRLLHALQLTHGVILLQAQPEQVAWTGFCPKVAEVFKVMKLCVLPTSGKEA